MDSRAIALRDALRNDLPRLVARQEELEKALDELASDLKDDPMGTGFRLAARFPELQGLMPILSSANLIPVDELYKIAEQHRVPDGTVQRAAGIVGRLLEESPLLMAALHRIFPLREPSQGGDKPTQNVPKQSKASSVANLRGILAGRLWSYAGDANDEGRFAGAVNALEQAIELAHEAGDWLLEAWALWKIALIDPIKGIPRGFVEFHKMPSNYLKRAQGYYLRALQILDTNPAAQDNQEADALKVRLLLLLCASTLVENSRETLRYSKRAHDIGVRRKNESDMFEALIIGGTALILLNEPSRALLLLYSARKIAIESKDTLMMSRVLMQMGTAWGEMNKLSLASAAMTAFILLEEKEPLEPSSETAHEAFRPFREAAHRIKENGETEAFLSDVNHAIDSVFAEFMSKWSESSAPEAGRPQTPPDSPADHSE